MNIATIEKMENFAKSILNTSPEQQEEVWEALKSVLTGEEVRGLMEYVSLYHLMTDTYFYNTVKQAIGEQILQEVTA